MNYRLPLLSVALAPLKDLTLPEPGQWLSVAFMPEQSMPPSRWPTTQVARGARVRQSAVPPLRQTPLLWLSIWAHRRGAAHLLLQKTRKVVVSVAGAMLRARSFTITRVRFMLPVGLRAASRRAPQIKPKTPSVFIRLFIWTVTAPREWVRLPYRGRLSLLLQPLLQPWG